MKIRFSCDECRKTGNDEEYKDIEDFLQATEVSDEPLYSVKCQNGHECVFYLSNQKYELLYDFAIMALKDGYYREAVASAAASLERFYEYSIKFLCNDRYYNEDDYLQEIKMWKKIKKLSERQLGAYCALYFAKIKMAPPTLSQENIEFRNDVIHNGKFCTKSEAYTFLQEVYDIITKTLNVLRTDLPDNWDFYNMNTGKARTEKNIDILKNKAVPTLVIPCFLATTTISKDGKQFKEYVDTFQLDRFAYKKQ